MAKKMVLFHVILFLTISKLVAQHISRNRREEIKLVEYNYTFIPHRNPVDTISDILSSGKKIKIYLFDFRGQMKVEYFNNKSILLERGNYVNSLDLLKSYTYAIGIGNRSKSAPTTSIEVDSFYEPLRNGPWEFYKDGKLYMTKKYKKGVLIDSLVIKSSSIAK